MEKAKSWCTEIYTNREVTETDNKGEEWENNLKYREKSVAQWYQRKEEWLSICEEEGEREREAKDKWKKERKVLDGYERGEVNKEKKCSQKEKKRKRKET